MPAKLSKCIVALVAVLISCSTGLAEDGNGAGVSILANRLGRVSIHYDVWAYRSLRPEQVQEIESAIGVQLHVTSPDHNNNDDRADQGPGADSRDPAERPVLYTARRTAVLSRTGFEFEGDVDLWQLAGALKDCGVSELEIAVFHPKEIAPGGSTSTRTSIAAIRDEDSRVYTLGLAASAPSDFVIHIAYGDRGPSAGWRLGAILGLLLLMIAIVIWLRRIALRDLAEGNRQRSFAHFRFINVTSFLLPICWWMVFSVVDFRTLAHYWLGFGAATKRAVAEGLIGVMLPCLIFWTCALIWRPVWRAIPVRVSKPGDPSRSPLDLFLGSFLPLLMIFGGLFYVFEGVMSPAAVLCLAGMASAVLRLKLLVKPSELQKYVLLAPELRQRVFDLAASARVRVREVFVVPETGHRLMNAFAASNSTVWLSEYLLRRLSKREVDAIVAHELGHLKRGHPILRGLAFSGALVGGLIPSLFLREMEGPGRHRNLVFPASIALGIGLALFLARRLEYSADHWSVKINGDPESVITALVRITQDGQLPLNWSKWDEKLLTHPSTQRRVSRIAAMNGITQDRLAELMSAPTDADQGYSLAAGSSGPPSVVSTALRAQPAPARESLQTRTRYSAVPPVAGLLASTLLLLLVLLEPDLFGSNENLLASPTGSYCLASAVLAGMLTFLLASRSVKRKLSKNLIGPFTFVQASADHFPGLDAASVNSYTAAVELLGFVATGDYLAQTSGTVESLKQFLRVFVGAEQKCWARISQVTTGTLGVTKVECLFASSLGDGYVLYTSSAEPSPILYAARLPREIRVYVPGAAPADLLSSHMARLERLAANAGLASVGVRSGDDFLHHELDRAADRRRLVTRLNAWLFLLRIDAFSRKPKMEWSGRDRKIDGDPTPGNRTATPETQRA